MPRDRHIEDRRRRVKVDVEVNGTKGVVDFNRLKAGGFIKQRQKDLFTVRLRCPGGRVPAERLRRVAEVAERHGQGYVHLSVRQSLEIPYVDYHSFDQAVSALEEVGQRVASCGARVRVPTACGGCEYNPNGLTDTQRMAQMVDERFFGTACAHKFKITFAGCPIDCPRSSGADLGFQGATLPVFEGEMCLSKCILCAKACQEGAISIEAGTGRPIRDEARCLYCADCVRVCPTEAWRIERTGWVVRVGGKHGRHPLIGALVARFVPDERVPDVIQGTLDWYHRHSEGRSRVRLGEVIRQVGISAYMAHMKGVFEDCAVPGPRPPLPVEVHH